MIKKMRWNGWVGIQVDNYPRVDFYGRKPVAVGNEHLRKALLSLGTVGEKDGGLYYKAPLKLINADGSYCWIDDDGIVEYDESKLAPRYFRDGRCTVDDNVEPL